MAEFADKERTLRSLLALAQPTTEDFRAMFKLCGEVHSASSTGNEACLNDILNVARRAGHLRAVCVAHQYLADVLRNRGDYAGSLAHAHNELAAARECGEPRYEASYHFQVGRVHEANGRYAEARRCYEESLAIYRRIGHLQGERAVLNQLGNIAWCQGDPQEALERYQGCIVLSGEGGTEEESVTWQHNIGLALQALGRWEDAVESYHRALALVEKSTAEPARTRLRCRVLCSLGELLARRDMLDRAVEAFGEVIDAGQRGDEVRPDILAEAYARLGQALHRSGEWIGAEHAFQSGLDEAARRNDRVNRVGVLWRAAELALVEGQLSLCHAYTAEAVGLAQEMGLTVDLADSWRVQALLHAARSEPQSARDCFERALQLLESLDQGYELAMVRFHYGRFLLAAGDRAAGDSQLRAAARMFRGLSVVPEVEEINRLLFSEEDVEDPDTALLHAVSGLAVLGLDPRRFLEQVLKVICLGTRCDSGIVLVDEVPQATYGRAASVVPAEAGGDEDVTNTPTELSWTAWRSGASVARLFLRRSVPARTVYSRFVLQTVSSLMAPAFERLARHARPPRATDIAGLKYDGVIGHNRLMLEALATVRQVADGEVSVLIRGESGTGKRLVARALHDSGMRAAGPFVAVNCAVTPEGLLEAELFGVKNIPATGFAPRKGKFESANGGTVLLEEVADLSPSLQTKLLRLLLEKRLERVGGSESVTVDVRVVAATSRDIARMTTAEQFRADLNHLLKGAELLLPPLRDRKEDIPELAQYFIVMCNQQYGRNVRQVEPDALSLLVAYSWPGNIRELRHAVERGVIIAAGDAIRAQDLPAAIVAAGAGPPNRAAPV